MASRSGQQDSDGASAGSSWRDRFWGAFPSLFQSIVVAVVGFALTGQVELALKDRQATLAGVQAMGQLLQEIAKAKADNDDNTRRDRARKLSLYGIDAIAPLVMMGLTTTLPMEHAVEGLTLIAARHKKEVCVSVRSALDTEVKHTATDKQMELLRGLPEALRCHWWWRPSWFTS